MKKINKIKEKITIENILCLFIIISPILDIVSFTFRNAFNTNISPSTILRPIIPVVLIIFLFFKKDKKFKLHVFLICLLYAIYAIIHLYLFTTLKTGSSFGGISHEAQYIVNYSFMILNFALYMYIFKDIDIEKLKKSIVIAVSIYILSIFLSILTNTSSHTYVEDKIGYKGWIESGNSISAILILSMFIYLPYIKNKKYRKIVIPVLILVGIFLTTLIGTRVGLYGFIITAVIYVIIEIFCGLIHNKKINKKLICVISILLLLLITFVITLGSNTIQRRRHLQNKEKEIVDIVRKKPAHLTGDLMTIKKQIDNNELETGYMDGIQKKSIIDLYNTAEHLRVKNTDQRMQQLIYNIHLVKNQGNLALLLFGNGFVTNYRELVMETELVAILLNFGILGFILYLGPFLFTLIYGIYSGIKNRRNIDQEFLLSFLGCGLAFALSLLSGYVFFNMSTTIIVIVLNVILFRKSKQLNRKYDDRKGNKVLQD